MKQIICTVAAIFTLTACTDSTPSKPNPLGWLHVENGRIVDEANREVMLRGMNARIEGIFDVTFSDGRTRLEPIPTFAQQDAEEMAAVGINFLRLPMNWSGIEPEEGEFNLQYLEQVDEIIEHCRNAGIYVLLDFHQDAYSKELGEDGAPYWAILPQTEFTLDGPLEDLDERRGSPVVLAAFENFFDNTQGLMDRFMPTVELVAARYADDSTVLGYESMNEPVAFHANDGINKLFNFYRQVTQTIRALDTKHTIWMEPDASRNFLLVSDAPNGFEDSNTVYTPHMYPPFSDTSEWDSAKWIDELTYTYDRMLKEKEDWGAALVLGEWGANPRWDGSIPYIRASHSIFNQHLMGQSFWLWKENCQGFWGLYDHNEDDGSWTLNEMAAKEVGQPTVHAMPGIFKTLHFDPETARLSVELENQEAGWAQLFLPARWFPSNPIATLNGETLELLPLEHNRYEALIPAGNHTLVVE